MGMDLMNVITKTSAKQLIWERVHLMVSVSRLGCLSSSFSYLLKDTE